MSEKELPSTRLPASLKIRVTCAKCGAWMEKRDHDGLQLCGRCFKVFTDLVDKVTENGGCLGCECHDGEGEFENCGDCGCCCQRAPPKIEVIP